MFFRAILCLTVTLTDSSALLPVTKFLSLNFNYPLGHRGRKEADLKVSYSTKFTLPMFRNGYTSLACK